MLSGVAGNLGNKVRNASASRSRSLCVGIMSSAIESSFDA